MKQIFHIRTEAERVQPVLSLIVADKIIGFSITNKEATNLYELCYCSVTEWSEEELDGFFNAYNSFGEDFYQILISYGFREHLLVPAGSYRKNDGALLITTLKGISEGSSVVSEAIPEWQLYNVYAVPDLVHDKLRRIFPKATFRHQQTLSLRSSNAGTENGCIQIDFKSDDFTILVTGNSRLYYAGSFEYTTPADVIFHLLAVCRNFSLSQKETTLLVSGLIDDASALYKELYQYFINIRFRNSSWNGAEDYPAHFFTSFNDLALCAS